MNAAIVATVLNTMYTNCLNISLRLQYLLQVSECILRLSDRLSACHLLLSLSVYLSVHLHVPFACLSSCVSVRLFLVDLSLFTIYLPVCRPVSLPVCFSINLSIKASQGRPFKPLAPTIPGSDKDKLEQAFLWTVTICSKFDEQFAVKMLLDH